MSRKYQWKLTKISLCIIAIDNGIISLSGNLSCTNNNQQSNNSDFPQEVSKQTLFTAV